MLLQNLSYLTKIKPGPSAVSTKSPNHLTTREFPRLILSKKKKKKEDSTIGLLVNTVQILRSPKYGEYM